MRNTINNSTDKTLENNFQLSDRQQKILNNALKRGIYKELYERKYISEKQLYILIEKNT